MEGVGCIRQPHIKMNTKQTGSNITNLAVKTLTNSNSSAIQKKLAGSALSQTHTSKQTGKAMETIASNALNSPKYNNTTKVLAASVLSQSSLKR